jgi:predicted transcriptional regulator of viral defense system
MVDGPPQPPARTLSRREAEVIAWLEAERRPSISSREISEHFGWPSQIVWHTVSNLARKGWLTRTSHGHYETVLADTGGWTLPNPWAALGTSGLRYYVGFQSAAYERGLTPDRPGSVQICVPSGTNRPKAWASIPITLIFLRSFSPVGIEQAELHNFQIELATPEKILIDAAGLPRRIGGVHGLARVLDRAHPNLNWGLLVDLSEREVRGRAALRRVAALLEILDLRIPAILAKHARARRGESLLYLGERRIFGARGTPLLRWGVIDNIGASALREEILR